MALEGAEARSQAPVDLEDGSETQPSGPSKVCTTCHFSVDGHFGPSRPTKCWGIASQTAFRDLHARLDGALANEETIAAIQEDIGKEREASLDREVRLSKKIALLMLKLGEAEERESRLMEAVSALHTKIDSLSRQCASVRPPPQQSEAPAGKGKRKGKSKGKDHSAPSHSAPPDHDYVGDWAADSADASCDESAAIGDVSSRSREEEGPNQQSHTEESQRAVRTSARTGNPVRTTHKQRDDSPTPTQPRFPAMQSDDGKWQLVCKSKPRPPRAPRADLFVGNLSEDATEPGFLDFIKLRAFWPFGLYVRRWHFKEGARPAPKVARGNETAAAAGSAELSDVQSHITDHDEQSTTPGSAAAP